MKKLIFTLCAVFCAVMFSFEAGAQDQEILRLKNGTEITGIIERLPNGGARVTDINGDTFVFAADEIALITNAEQKARQEKAEKRKRSGYAGIVQAGIGYSMEGGVDFTVGMINAWKINPWFYLGLGLDLGTTAIYDYGNYDALGNYYGGDQGFIMPIYLHLRYSILGGRPNNKVSPYISFNLGYETMQNGGFFFGPSAGIQIKNLKIGDMWVGFDFPFRLGGNASMIDLCVKVGWSF